MMKYKNRSCRREHDFSPEFKQQVIEDYLNTDETVGKLCRRHDITYSRLYLWLDSIEEGRNRRNVKNQDALGAD